MENQCVVYVGENECFEMSPDAIIVKVATLNCWALPIGGFFSKDQNHRILAIGDAFGSRLEFDVICLQEVWNKKDFSIIKNLVKNNLPYSHYFYSGVVGSGICLFSRWPITDVVFHQWQINGYMHKIWHGDWFGGKGVGLCRINVHGFKINVFTTHLHAQYDTANSDYVAHRVIQAFDTARFIHIASQGADMSILAGDINTLPHEIAFKILKLCGHLHDTFDIGSENINNLGTFGCERNSYSKKEKVMEDPKGERIDYILYRGGQNSLVKCTSYYFPLPDRIPDGKFSYSDHEAIAATFIISKKSVFNTDSNHVSEDCLDVEGEISALEEGCSICEEELKRLSSDKKIYWICTLILVALFIIVPTYTDIPKTYELLYSLVLFVGSCISVFTISMATIWNGIEYHAIKSTKYAMQLVKSHLCIEKSEKTVN